MKPLQVVESLQVLSFVEAVRFMEDSDAEGGCGGEMHEMFAWHSSWSIALYSWARTLVGIVLWFWVVSGAIFALRYLVFVLPERNGGSPPLRAASVRIPFPIDRFKEKSRYESSQE